MRATPDTHAPRRRLPNVAEKGGSGPSSAISKWPFRWPWFQHSITLRNVAVPSPLKRTILCLPGLTLLPLRLLRPTQRPLRHRWSNTWIQHPLSLMLLASSPQLPPACTITTDTADDNFDITDLVNTQFSRTAVETFAPQVVVSLPPNEVFSAPVYNQVHQEQIAAGETTENIAEILDVQEQVIVQGIPHAPQVVDSSPPLEDFAVQPYVPLHESPEVQVAERIQEQIVEAIDVTPQASQMILNTSSTSTSMLDSCLEQLTPFAIEIESIEKETERVAMLTKRMLEPPLPEPPLPEPPMVEPPMLEPDRTSGKRRRRTRYTPLPGIMENAVYLAPSAWPVRHV